ncbi:MAG: TfoX/Sxy family protein [Rhodospirillales bacterium]|nr:TfoX/Sxy family protein [Rhodospirillales bacterium]
MAAPYRHDLEALLGSLKPDLPKDTDITCKHFFSGAAAYANGKIFMSLSPVGLALKLPEATRAAVMAKGGTPLRYFPKAPIKKDYVVLPKKLAADKKALAALIRDSVSSV